MTVVRLRLDRGWSKSKVKIATASPNRSALATRGARMLSPKMQRSIRVQETQLCVLAERAHFDKSMAGYLHKRQADTNKWQLRWFLLYQNLLFYYESESCNRPSGVVMLEGCYCERLIASSKGKDSLDKQYCFAISYRRENQRQYELRASSESDCKMWIEAVRDASFNKLLLQKEELEQKHLHLLQIVESEKTAKWQYTQQCEELASEIKKLRAELCALKKEWRPMAAGGGPRGGTPFSGLMNVAPPLATSSGAGAGGSRAGAAGPAGGSSGALPDEEESLELRKIKKVQSFFRGWLCRRRWKQIVEQYIKSPHAESMRKRNSLVFRMVESEEEYMEQMEVLVSCFLRPFKMAASSKKPPCSHEDVNSIFLNSETVLFLHQIFLKGLTSRMESWPTLVLGDLFDMLLPMLSIYQEYVRNHHYSLQVLTECKQAPPFAALLTRLENKPSCQGRSLEMFLTYPMHQIPRYIITLHELLAHTPHDHVERKSLQNARQQLEDLSRQMHDEVSETENLRKNLAVERMIVEGCDILLDVNQVFVRQGTLIQFPGDKQKRSRLTNFKSEKEAIRQCFLFSNHLIIATRTSGGRLHLVPDVGKIPLADALLIEDPSDQGVSNDDDESSVCSMSSQSSGMSELSGGGTGKGGSAPHHNRDFKIIVDVNKSGGGGGAQSPPQMCVHLVAPTMQEKAAWISDISQCMDNVHFNDLLHSSMSDTSSVTMPQSMKNDPKLFKDDIDIRFSRTLNSCKVPQIRYATPERLLGRLTDLRFLSIDFLNTFLLTYRVFTDGVTVLEALKKVFYQTAESPDASAAFAGGAGTSAAHTAGHPGAATHMQPGSIISLDAYLEPDTGQPNQLQLYCDSRQSPRRPSGASSVSGYGSEASDRRLSSDSQKGQQHWRSSFRKYDEEQQLSLIRERESSQQATASQSSSSSSAVASVATSPRRKVSIRVEQVEYCGGGGGGGGGGQGDEEEVSYDDDDEDDSAQLLLAPPHRTAMAVSSSAETLTDVTVISAPQSPSNLSSVTLVGSSGGSDPSVSPQDPPTAPGTGGDQLQPQSGSGESHTPQHPQPTSQTPPTTQQHQQQQQHRQPPPPPPPRSHQTAQASSAASSSSAAAASTAAAAASTSSSSSHHLERRWSDKPTLLGLRKKSEISLMSGCSGLSDVSGTGGGVDDWTSNQDGGGGAIGGGGGSLHYYHPSASHRSASVVMQNYLGRRSLVGGGGDGEGGGGSVSQRTSFQHESPQHSSKAGVVITSFRQSQRRSSTSTAAAAFAIATSASSNPRDYVGGAGAGAPMGGPGAPGSSSCRERMRRKESVMSTAATMRVLNVLKHWISKHGQDFELSSQLKSSTIEFLEDIVYSPNLLPAEHKAASQLLRLLSKDEPDAHHVDLDLLLAPPLTPSKESIETLSALEIAEQMTYLDHKIFISISCEEFLGQAWMKSDKATRAPNIILMTRRFNEVSQLVVSEIVGRPSMSARVNVIEKWAAVADIARCLHNFNGVLQICAAFTNSSVYRLKKTWEKVSKTTRQTIEKLQVIVSSDGRFRNLRDALHRCDPPCIPYLGMYLTDLSFIEEGTPNFTDDGLLNFSKMRMIAHVIREIRHFQQTPYKIDLITKVTNYLLDSTLLLDDDHLYKMSLHIEPRTSRLSAAHLPQLNMMATPTASASPAPSPSHSAAAQRSSS